MSLSSIVQAMNLDHILATHLYNDKVKYQDVVKNDQNNVRSVVYPNNAYKITGQRKTIFPESMTAESLEKELQYIYNTGTVLCKTKTIQYIQHPISSLIVGMSKNKKDYSDLISTAYPVLRYISLHEIESCDKNIYIAHAKSKDSKELVKIERSAADIKALAPKGVYIGSSLTKEIVVTDIAADFTELLFSGKINERGSILVERRNDQSVLLDVDMQDKKDLTITKEVTKDIMSVDGFTLVKKKNKKYLYKKRLELQGAFYFE